MGCCSSRPANNEEAANPPARPLATQNQSQNLDPTSSQAAINRPSAASSHPALNPARPNTPIRPPTPAPKLPKNTPHPRPWNRSLLEAEREAFFDTRVTGDSQVWAALRVVAGFLREGRVLEAQGILDASGITCPNGRVAGGKSRSDGVRGGVYDERGVLYEVPAWVVAEPGGVVEEEEEGGEGLEKEGEGEEEEGLGVGKGKGREVDVGELLVVKARLSHTGSDMTVRVGSRQKVGVLVRQVMQQIQGKRVRLAYLGRILDENRTLEEQGWARGHVVNAMVFEGDEAMLRRGSAGGQQGAVGG